MGYEVLSKSNPSGMLEPMSTNFFSCSPNEGKCSPTNRNCSGCGEGAGCNLDVPVNGSCGGGHKDFKCTRNGGCAACDMIRSSRFVQY